MEWVWAILCSLHQRHYMIGVNGERRLRNQGRPKWRFLQQDFV